MVKAATPQQGRSWVRISAKGENFTKIIQISQFFIILFSEDLHCCVVDTNKQWKTRHQTLDFEEPLWSDELWASDLSGVGWGGGTTVNWTD